MHHRIVDRRADGGRVALVVQEGRNGVVFPDQLLGIYIQGSGGNTGLHSFAQLLQHLIEECARFAHFPDLIGIFQTNHYLTPKVSMMDWKITSMPCAPSMRCSRPFSS